MLGGSGSLGRRSLAALSQIAYQRNDDDEEEAARERRRRARQERLRQKQEEESLGQVTDQVEVNARNSVPDEEAKPASINTQAEGDEEAALLERLARREERRQKRLQEALERQKELDPAITDSSLSLPSRRMQNDTAEDEDADKEGRGESRQERYEIEQAELVTKACQRNDWRDAEDDKKEEREKEEEDEERPKQGSAGEKQVEVMVEEKPAGTQEEATVMVLSNGQIGAEETKLREEGGQGSWEFAHDRKVEEEERKRAEAERLRLEEEERERVKAEQEKKIAEERARVEAEEKAAAQERERQEAEERERAKEEERRAAEERQRAKAEEEAKARTQEQKQKKQLEEKRSEVHAPKTKTEKGEEKREGKWVNEKKVQEDKPHTAVPKKQEEEKGVKGQAHRQKSQEDKAASKKQEIKDEKIKKDKEPKEEAKSFLDQKKGFAEVKTQNGEFMTHKLKHTENTFSPGRLAGKEADGAPQVEAGKRLEELRRRRGETESEEFEKLKQKQQEAAQELEELKRRREERRKVLEEEEQKRKQEEAGRKAREEEEKRRLKEEIERRRAEAAEKRQKMPEDGLSDDKKPFKCFTPKGSSLKIEERAEFLSKSAQKSSGVKSTHQAAVVSKIDSRLEQYTSAIEGTKAAKSTKPAASDLPVPAEGVRNIKSMWEKGNVFSAPTAPGTPNKETAGLKVGVSSRINEWLTKTPDGNKSPAPKPADLRPGDVSGKRNLWEKQSVDKVTSPTKEPVFKETHAVK
ncbi:caldesmon [Ctenodactylus gundi]